MLVVESAPLACTLDLTDTASRFAWIRRLTERSLLSHQLDGRTLRLVYRSDAASEVERLVSLERTCCAFLDFSLQATPSETVLTINAPAGSEADAQALFAQFIPWQPKACGCTRGCG